MFGTGSGITFIARMSGIMLEASDALYSRTQPGAPPCRPEAAAIPRSIFAICSRICATPTPAGLEETILTELVANSLDAGASVIRMSADPAATTFRLEDDGRGMVWKELRAVPQPRRQRQDARAGIGFAGVGIKLALLAAREVVTESRRGKSHAASRWHLASREFAPYEPIAPPGVVREHGTAVLLH